MRPALADLHQRRPGWLALAQDNPPLRLLKAVVFTLVGVGLLAGDLSWAISTRRFLAHAVSAPGVVVRLNAGGAHPEVRFTTSAGKIIDYPQGGMIWGYRAGDKVRVLYNPQNPADPVIDTMGALWGFAFMNFLLGAVFLGMAALLWRSPDVIE